MKHFGLDVRRNLATHRLDSGKKIDQHIRISKDQRHFRRTASVRSQSSAASSAEREPARFNISSRRRRRSSSPERYFLFAESKTPEKPFSPRRAAMARSAL